MNLPAKPTIAINGVVVDVAGGLVRDGNGREIPLRPQAFGLLTYLLANSGRLVSKDELMKALWPGVFVTDDSLVQCVRDVRRALNDDAQSVLKTVPRRGYRLTVLPAAPPKPVRPARWPAAALAGLGLIGLLVAAGSAWRLERVPSVAPASNGPPVVVVEAFVDQETGEELRRLALDMCEDFSTDLSSLREFLVVLRDPSYSSGKLADGLDANFVVRGAVHHEGGRLRITAQLVDATGGELLWSEQWDRPAKDVSAVQKEIAGLISNRLGGNSGQIQEAGRLAARGKTEAELTTYDLYLAATEKLERIDRAGAEEAVRLLKASADVDPDFARTWVELYLAHDLLAALGVERERNRQAAADAAQRAVDVGPSDPKAHAVLGLELRQRKEFVRAKSELNTALTLAPMSAEILTLYAGSASSFGQAERGADIADQVMQLRPGLPMSAIGPLSSAYFMAGRYAKALAVLDRLPTENHTMPTWTMRAAALAAVGRPEEAKGWVARALAAMPNISVETTVNETGYNDADRRRLIDSMRLAGFPLCATREALAEISKPVRLPECEAHD